MYANLKVAVRKPGRSEPEVLSAHRVEIDPFTNQVLVHTDLNDGDANHAVEGPVRTFKMRGLGAQPTVITADY